jgi:aromatic amino acid aminotransferase I
LKHNMAPPSAIEVTAESDISGITIPNPLAAPIASNEILGRREKAARTQWALAAGCDTANFRQKSYAHKPKAKRWDRKRMSLYFKNV